MSLRGANATKQSIFAVSCVDAWIASLALAMTVQTDVPARSLRTVPAASVVFIPPTRGEGGAKRRVGVAHTMRENTLLAEAPHPSHRSRRSRCATLPTKVGGIRKSELRSHLVKKWRSEIAEPRLSWLPLSSPWAELDCEFTRRAATDICR